MICIACPSAAWQLVVIEVHWQSKSCMKAFCPPPLQAVNFTLGRYLLFTMEEQPAAQPKGPKYEKVQVQFLEMFVLGLQFAFAP